jgi:hypothetical protein
MKFKKALHAALATAALATGVGVLSATPASATSFVCVTLNGASSAPCGHQSTLYANNSNFNGQHEWWGPYTVLKLQNDGNLVLYCQGDGSNKAVWASNTSQWNIDNVHLTFWNDGNLALYMSTIMSETGQPVGGQVAWNSQTWGGSGSTAVVQADGNFVIWANGKALWASNTYHACPGTENYWNGYQ